MVQIHEKKVSPSVCDKMIEEGKKRDIHSLASSHFMQ